MNLNDDDAFAMQSRGYMPVRAVASGAFGSVIEAVQEGDGTTVAIKIVRIENMKPHERKLVEDEITVLSQVSHPNIMQFVEYFTSDDLRTVYIVTEFLKGGDLFDRIAQSLFTEEQAIDIAIQVIEALSYMKSLGLAHRDIKLENLVFSTMPGERKQIIKLVDFGYATRVQELMPGGRVGTVNYMSPEVIQRISYSAEKLDVWSLGVVLYAAVSGRLPFYGHRDSDTESMILGVHPGFKEKQWSKMSAAFTKLITSMLHKKSDARPNIGEVEMYLAAYIHAKKERTKARQARRSNHASRIRNVMQSTSRQSMDFMSKSTSLAV